MSVSETDREIPWPSGRTKTTSTVGGARYHQVWKGIMDPPSHSLCVQHADAWVCVLSRASPRLVARLSRVCRCFYSLAGRLAALDVACGCEDVMLLAPSVEEAAKLRRTFTYTRTSSGEGTEDAEPGSGCNCANDGVCFGDCACAAAQLECGPGCSCARDCPHRETQRPLSRPLSLQRDARRGWGVFAESAVPMGTFVCTYSGEVIGVEMARRRLAEQDACGKGNYILVLREHFSGGILTILTCVDPTHVGNVGRFLNHSCDQGNLELRIVRSSGCALPRAAFYARRQLRAGEELTYAYGLPAPASPSCKRCFCGTAACLGALPKDDV